MSNVKCPFVISGFCKNSLPVCIQLDWTSMRILHKINYLRNHKRPNSGEDVNLIFQKVFRHLAQLSSHLAGLLRLNETSSPTQCAHLLVLLEWQKYIRLTSQAFRRKHFEWAHCWSRSSFRYHSLFLPELSLLFPFPLLPFFAASAAPASIKFLPSPSSIARNTNRVVRDGG